MDVTRGKTEARILDLDFTEGRVCFRMQQTCMNAVRHGIALDFSFSFSQIRKIGGVLYFIRDVRQQSEAVTFYDAL